MQTLNSAAAFGRIAGVCLLTSALGGCYTMGGGGQTTGAAKPTSTTTTPPTPAKFTPVLGQFMAKAVVGSGSTDTLSYATDMRVDSTPGGQNVEANVTTSPDNSALRRASFIIGSIGQIASDNATIESNGSAVRGQAVNSQNDWVVLSNAPGSRLDASLGATSLEHSYAGTAWKSSPARGPTGRDITFGAAGIFGGRSTSDMPTSGKADYAGGFEGVENSSFGATVQTSSLSGKANLTADFAARTVRGRIDDVKNHNAGPIPQSTAYSIGYTGTITGSAFSGTSWLTQANSDAPLAYAVQNGTLQGGFFGPGAAETAGGLSAAATLDSNRKMLVTGAFGAKKK